jgi:hypothetical protein
MAEKKILTYTYVDNSNLFIEGQRLAAIKKGLALDLEDAIDRRIFDFGWNVDYGKLHKFLCGDKYEVGCAKLWGSLPPEDSFWQMVESRGWQVFTYARSYGKERKVDSAIAYHIGKDAVTLDKAASEITLVAGDKDHVPAIEDLLKEGYNVSVAFWDHAAQELKDLVGGKFFSLNKWHDHLCY